MTNNIFNRKIQEDFVVIDSVFPQKQPRAFRNSEINEYFKRVKNCSSYTMYPMKPDKDAWFRHGYGIDEKTFYENKKGYLEFYPQNKNRVKYLFPNKKYKFKLAYSYFLAETYTLLPFYEKHKIPFMFVLYPGGAFGLNFDKSDAMLKKIFNSKLFRGVIVTQLITKNYLIEKKLCKKRNIHYIQGGFIQFKKEDVQKKQLYKKDKQTFDICFVAKKYTPKGVDKGYDVFIDVAKKLCKLTDDIMFHVVGDFGPEEIDISDIKSRITFYGYRQPDFLKDFYSRMDIFLSPNRPFKLYPGNFDGFPLGGDAAYCGVARFVSDELKMNTDFKNGLDIVIIPVNSDAISNMVYKYYNNIDKLYRLSKEGQILTKKLLEIDRQINERLEIFREYIDIKENI